MRWNFVIIGLAFLGAAGCGSATGDQGVNRQDGGPVGDGASTKDASLPEPISTTGLEVLSYPPEFSPETESTILFITKAFEGSEVATVQCSLDGAPKSDCQSPVQLRDLEEGDHVLQITVTNADGQESTADIAWHVDVTAPALSHSQTPSAVTHEKAASFFFEATDTGSGIAQILCRLDAGEAQPCTSPHTYAELIEKTHSFALIATDKAGNTETAEWTWDVLSGPKKIIMQHFFTCAITKDDDFSCVRTNRLGTDAPKVVATVGKVTEAAGRYHSIGVIQANGNVAGWDQRLSGDDLFSPSAFSVAETKLDMRGDKLTIEGNASIHLSGPERTLMFHLDSSPPRLYPEYEFRIVDSTSSIATSFGKVVLRADGIPVRRKNLEVIQFDEAIVALDSSTSAYRNYYLDARGTIWHEQFNYFSEDEQPPEPPVRLGALPGAKDITTDRDSTICLIGADNRVKCGSVLDTPLRLVEPADLGPVRDLEGTTAYSSDGLSGFCAIEIRGVVKCWTSDEMVARVVDGF